MFTYISYLMQGELFGIQCDTKQLELALTELVAQGATITKIENRSFYSLAASTFVSSTKQERGN